MSESASYHPSEFFWEPFDHPYIPAIKTRHELEVDLQDFNELYADCVRRNSDRTDLEYELGRLIGEIERYQSRAADLPSQY